MISVMVASIFLPFLPMRPVHILAQNLLCDFSQMGIPFDNVDEEYIKIPRSWDTKGLQRFMFVMGPLSSLFDIICFAVLWFIVGANTIELSKLFQSGWFIFGTLSQILVVYMIRTRKIPFIQSKASAPLMLSSAVISILACILGFTKAGISLDLSPLPLSFAPWLALILAGYFLSAQLVKNIYIRKYGEWI